MKNIFQIIFDQTTKTSSAEYERYIIRRLSKKEEEKINNMSNRYGSAEKKLGLPKWLYFMLRVSFMGTMTCFLLWLLFLFTDIEDGFALFFQKNLWLEITFLVILIIFIVALILSTVFKKKAKSSQFKNNANEIFEGILKESKRCLKIPETAIGLEVLMDQAILKKNGLKESKSRFFSNVVLSVFIEDDLLCLADLYVVIGIPLKEIKSIEEIKEIYRFQYWHKKTPIQEYQSLGIKEIKTTHCYQGSNYYAITCFNDSVFYVSPYEIQEWKNLLIQS